jgi:hypothetical protein
MARVIFGQGVSSILGKVGGTIFQRGPYGGVARNWEHKANSRTASQIRSRTAHGIILATWRSLAENIRNGWDTYAATQSPVSKGQAPYFLTGQQHYYRVNRRRWSEGVPQSYWHTIPATNGLNTYVWSFAQAHTSLGGSVLPGELAALNTFAEQLWSRDKFDSCPIMWIPVGDTLDAALLCFAGSSSFDFSLINTGFTQENWKGSGAGYGLESLTHNRHLTIPDFSMVASPPTSILISYSHLVNRASQQYLMGLTDGVDWISLRSNPSLGSLAGRSGDADQVLTAASPTQGVVLVERTTIPNLGLWIDGTQVDSEVGLLTCNYPAGLIRLFAYTLGGAAAGLSDVRISGLILSQYDDPADTFALYGYFRSLMTNLASLH